MELRAVADPDSDAIHDLVERSFRTSYSLSPTTIEALLDEWFAPDQLSQRVDGQDTSARIAERDGRPVGYVEGRVRESTGTLLWLHVAPDARGQGVGTRLFEAMQSELREAGADRVRARVLADNSEGEEFVERFGFSEVDYTAVEIDDEELTARVFSPEAEPTTPDVPETTTVDGETLVVDDDAPVPGDDAEFLPAYREDARENRDGFYCTNCGTVSVTVDGLDRVECETCGNLHRPDDWDGAYL